MTPQGRNFSVFVINLDRDVDRLLHIRHQLDRAGLPFTRIPGLLASSLPEPLAAQLADASHLKAGEIGCFAAHLSIYQLMIADPLTEVALVLEDDALFPADLGDVVDRILARADPDWDIIRLSNPPKRAFVETGAVAGGYCLVRYSKIPNLTTGYLIRRRGALKLWAAGLKTRAFDEYLRRPWLHDCQTYGLVPPAINSERFQSTIDRIEPRRHAGPALLRTLAKADLSRAFDRFFYNIKTLGWRNWLGCQFRNSGDRLIKRLPQRPIPHGIVALPQD